MNLGTVYLARHGETEWNTQGRKQGQLDSPLTDRGLRHADALAALSEKLGVDAVFSSPIGRARSTAQASADRLGIRLVVLDELAEMHHGRMAGLTDAEMDSQFPAARQQRAADKYRWRFPGGEGYADVDLRAARALMKLADLGARTPLIVSHEMIGRMLLRNLLDIHHDDALRLRQPNNCVVEVNTARGQLRRLTTT